MPSSEY